ncbi:Polyadenylate-binding protein 1-like protein [Myotis davidii]|uniref:Polyadenylate-binding protein 1-like protein n=1 Tax=Myotis davidii TaxID=225400 RepID=L5LUF6_MYODS|nr:Polyadenylate-binding protein 1-like protein [Myotis davidii]
MGDLHPEGAEAMFSEKFPPAGPSLSINVNRDVALDGLRLHHLPASADAAWTPDTELGGYQSPTAPCGPSETQDLESRFGKMLSVKARSEDSGHAQGFGFVTFEKQKAVQSGKEVGQQLLYVGRAQEQQNELKRRFQQMEQMEQDRLNH